MNSGNLNSENPYQAPTQAGPDQNESESRLNQWTEEKFKQQIIALGGFWIFIGLLVIAVTTVYFFKTRNLEPDNPSLIVFILLGGITGTLWTVIGILTCRKIIPAVWVGLVLSYISLISGLMQFNINFIGLVIMGLVIAQAHRVIRWSKQR